MGDVMEELEHHLQTLSLQAIHSAAFIDLEVNDDTILSEPTNKTIDEKKQPLPTLSAMSAKEFWQKLLGITWNADEIGILRQMVKQSVEDKLGPKSANEMTPKCAAQLLLAYNEHFFQFKLLDLMKQWQIRLNVTVQPKLDQGRLCQCVLRSRNEYCLCFSETYNKLFTQGETSLAFGSLKCCNRLEAMMLTLEHELLHLMEMMAFDCSTTSSPFSPCSPSPAMVTTQNHSNEFKQVQMQWFGQSKCVHKFAKGDAEEAEAKQTLLDQMRAVLQVGDSVTICDPKTKTRFSAQIEKLNPKTVRVLILPELQHVWSGSYACIEHVG